MTDAERAAVYDAEMDRIWQMLEEGRQAWTRQRPWLWPWSIILRRFTGGRPGERLTSGPP